MQLWALQKMQLGDETQRQQDLSAEEAASRRAIETGRTGRGLLAFTPAASTGSETLGGS
ncbi:MAG: hypothetical protein WDM81_13870 [Rhizomicrobium sp.]